MTQADPVPDLHSISPPSIDPYQALVYTGPVKDDKGHSESIHVRLSQEQRSMILRTITDPETPWDDVSSFIRSSIAFFFDSLAVNITLRRALLEEIHMMKAERLIKRRKMIEGRAKEFLETIASSEDFSLIDEIAPHVRGFPAFWRDEILTAIDRKNRKRPS